MPPEALRPGDIVPAVVVKLSDGKPANPTLVRIGTREVELPRTGFAWTRAKSPQDLFKVGDVIEVDVGSARRRRARRR